MATLTLRVAARSLTLTVTAAPPPPAPAYTPAPVAAPGAVYTVELRAPDGSMLSRADNVNVATTALRWTTGERGFGDLTLGLRETPGGDVTPAYLPEPIEMREGADVLVSCNGQPCYAGRVTRVLGLGRGLAARGWGIVGLTDGVYRGAGAGLVPAGVILRDALASASRLRAAGPDAFLDPGTPHAPAEFALSTPAQIVDQLCKEGAGGATWRFAVWFDRRATFLPGVAPAEGPRYAVEYDARMTWDRDGEQVYSGVVLSYTAADGAARTVEINNPGAAQWLGFERVAALSGPAGVSDAGAAQFAQTWLADRARPVVSASLTRPDGRGLELATGGEAGGQWVRAGEWAQVGRAEPGNPPLPITATTFDAMSGALSVQLGPPSPRRLAGLLQRLTATAVAAQQGRNVVSGGRAALPGARP